MTLKDRMEQLAAEGSVEAVEEYEKLRAKIRARATSGKWGKVGFWIADNIKWLILGTMAAFFLGWAYQIFNRASGAPVGASIPAVVAWEVKQEAKVGADVKSGQVKVFGNRNKVMQKLDLPDAIKNNPNKEVAAASVIAPDGFAHGHTETAILDTKTGEVELLDRVDPLPWARWRTDGYVWVGGGLLNGEMGARALVVQNFASIKSLTLSAMASVDQPIAAGGVANNHGTGTFVGLGVTVPFDWK